MDYRNLFRRRFGNSCFFVEGDGGDGGGGETPAWHADHPYLAENAEASKAYAKYTDLDGALKGGHEAMKKTGKAYWLPDDHSKLTDVQKAEIRSNVALMDGGVPDTADGYNLPVPEGTKSPIDEIGMADFKVFAKEKNIPVGLAKDLLGFQTKAMDRMNVLAEEALTQNAIETKKQFAKDCGGEAESVLRMQWIKEFLQSKCTDAAGKADPEMWKNFEPFFDKRGMEIVFLRAFKDAAQAARGTGGGAGPGSPAIVPGGTQEYAEMRGKG